MLERILDRTIPTYIMIACFLSLTYHQLSSLIFAQALTREHWIWKLNSSLRQLPVLDLNSHLEMPMLIEPMSMDSYEPQELVLSF